MKHAFKRLSISIDEIEDYNLKIKEYVLNLNPNILSIPGVGFITAGLILGEIGDISNFQNSEHLVSFSSLDIEVYESNKYKGKHYHPSEKGSKYLRYALFQVAKSIWRFDNHFNLYYLKKKSENKHFYVILGHIQKNLFVLFILF